MIGGIIAEGSAPVQRLLLLFNGPLVFIGAFECNVLLRLRYGAVVLLETCKEVDANQAYNRRVCLVLAIILFWLCDQHWVSPEARA